MCSGFTSPIQLISVEPSPKVFCEMTEIISTKLTQEDSKSRIVLNVALSDQTGYLTFTDPGNEGGKLIGNNFTELPKITPEELTTFSQCKYAQGEFRNMTVDGGRKSTVPTYTLDLLVSSLEQPGLNKIGQGEEIFVVKIDTEGEYKETQKFSITMLVAVIIIFSCANSPSMLCFVLQGHDYNVLLGAKNLLQNKRITFIIFEVWSNHFVKLVARHMAEYGYQCFMLTKDTLVPVHETDWWYSHMDNFTRGYWGNGLCGIKGSMDMQMLWRMYHSDNLKLINSYYLL